MIARRSTWKHLLIVAAGTWLLVSAGAAARAQDGGILAGPYVNSVSPTGATVSWIAAPGQKGSCRVEAAGAARAGTTTVEAVTSPMKGYTEVVYAAEVEELSAATTYRYRITCGEAVAEGEFQTAPPVGAKVPLRWLTYSDPQTYPERHSQVVRAVMKELPFAFLAISGDFAEDTSKLAELRDDFFLPARELLRRTALWTTRGNHEKDGVLYKEVFALPGNELYYSFDYGRLHYVMLDPYRVNSGRKKDKAQMDAMIDWLERDLDAARAHADWFIVSYHEPTYNVGGHADSWGRDDLWPVLARHGVDIVVSGHSHLYERVRPIGPEGTKPVVQIVSGGGGGPGYHTYPSPILDASREGLHYLVWTIDGNRLEVVAKTTEGEEFDRLTLVKTDGLYQKEVMDRMLLSEDAPPLVKVLKIHRLLLDKRPQPGRTVTGAIQAGSFPAGYRVRIAAAEGCKWKIKPLDVVADGGPVPLELTPPADMKLSATPWMGTFEPPISIDLSITKGDIGASADDVPVAMDPDALWKIFPAPEPVAVPPLPKGIELDGRFDDWQTVPPVVLPSTGKPSGALRLAWAPDGLYGAVKVTDADFKVDTRRPWQGDGVELGIETDRGRRLAIPGDTTRATMIFLYPSGDRIAVGKQGGKFDRKNVEVRGRKTAEGYEAEFRIAAEGLAPAKFVEGGKMGFNFILRTEPGEAAEHFADTRGLANIWGKPGFWGAIRFAAP